MTATTTDAWVLYEGPDRVAGLPEPGELVPERFTFEGIGAEEVLVEPIYGCWEGNMAHALARSPVDVCRQRKELRVVIGNAGVVRILRTGREVTTVREGDLAIVFPNGVWDRNGFMVLALAYDAPNTMGILARRAKLHERHVVPIPAGTRHSLARWAAFSLRYVTAWANWRVAYRCWQAQMEHVPPERTHVFAWGGGVSFAELTLAGRAGCRTAMMATGRTRLERLAAAGIEPIDRGQFRGLCFDPARYRTDPAYKEAYTAAEKTFLDIVREKTDGDGASIFIDNIGLAVARATLRAIGRGGVLSTVGWKLGMDIPVVRAIECINRHVHVHTHYAQYEEGLEAVAFADREGWMPPEPDRIYGWDEIPALAADYAAGRVETFFPIYAVNPPDGTP